MASEQTVRIGEEIANSVTHGIGLCLSLAGLAVLVALASVRGEALHVVSCAVYGTTLVAMYAASTLYHSARSPRAKHALKVLDHCSIYLLIAGTYTPFTLVTLRGGWGWTLFGVVWAMSVLGILFKLFFAHRFRVMSTLIYLTMGWLVVVAVEPLVRLTPRRALLLLVAGGLAYTAGTVFYMWKRLPYSHAVWHLFVLGGSACHYSAVMFCVVPSG
jgi:hemolysin III